MKNKNYKKYIGEVITNYTISQIQEEIKKLSGEKRTNLLKEYIFEKNYLSGEIILLDSDLTNEIKEQNKKTIREIKKELNKKYQDNTCKVRYFFSLFIGYTEEEVLNVVKTLTNEERNLLYKKYGNDLKSTKSPRLTKKEIEDLQYIVRKIKYILKSLKKEKDYLLEKNVKKIAREVILSKVDVKLEPMNSYERSLVHNILSKFDYIETKSEGEEPNRYVVIKYKEKEKAKTQVKEVRKLKYFFSLFEGYTEEEILNVVETLTNEERNLLYTKYGNDLKSTKPSTLSRKEKNIILCRITKKIKRYLNIMRTGDYIIIGIKDLLSLSDEQLKILLPQLNENTRNKLYFYFGEDLKKKSIIKVGKYVIIEIKDVLPYNDKQLEILLPQLNKNIKNKLYSNFGEDLKKKTIIEKNKIETFFLKEEKELMENILNNNTRRKKEFKSFISQFERIRKPNETDEELLIRIKRNLIKIKSEYIELIIKKYNEDLKNTKYNGLHTKEENKIIISHAIPSIKNFMIREERNLKTKAGTLEEINKLLRTDEYKNLTKLYGTKYATKIMIKLYMSNAFNLDGIIETNEEEILTNILAKEYLQMKKELLNTEKVDVKKLLLK